MTHAPTRLLYPYEEAAILLGLPSVQALRDLVHRGRGPVPTRIGRRVLFTPADLSAWIEAHRAPPLASPPPEPLTSCQRRRRGRPEHPNHVWSYDFVEARTHDGRKIRMLNVIDEFTRECLAIRVDRRLKGADVIDVLSDLFILRGVPGHVRSDNGPEFVAKAVQAWIAAWGPRPPTSLRVRPGRTAPSRASTPGFATSC